MRIDAISDRSWKCAKKKKKKKSLIEIFTIRGLCKTVNFQRILKSKPVLENIEKNKLEKLFGLANFFFIRSPKKQLKTEKNAMTGKNSKLRSMANF